MIRPQISLCVLVLSCMPAIPLLAQPLALAHDGATAYVIVTAAEASPVDRYAASELALYLEQMTGADFSLLDATDLAEAVPAIFVGLSTPALARLGDADPLAELGEQEHVWRTYNRDLFLYGKGIHGNLHAVMAFLEDQMGWRWYSVFAHPVLPDQPRVRLDPFAKRQGFAYAYRKVDLQRGFDFFYQQGMNMGFDARIDLFARRNMPFEPTWFVSALNDQAYGSHTLFHYIPPEPGARGADRWPWLEKRDYFGTHPDYFSLWENGQRVKNRQLCFSHPGLRAELTRNVLTTIERLGGPLLLSICAQDNPGRFCQCPGCEALESRHGSNGGPLYDYLFELCDLLAERHPGVRIHTLAYRRSQTQKPPVLPAGQMLPANLIVDFAPIEDSYFADWTHSDPSIRETYADLQAWGHITHPGNLWAWLYPNPWGTGIAMPVGNVKRVATNLRLMHAAGVRGVKTDHCSYHERGGWSELQAYLLYKLCRDLDADVDAIIVEFTDAMYGPSAPLMRTYLDELEAGRLAMRDLPPDVRSASPNLDAITFPYLTVTNIHRWQGYFDRMERALEGRPDREAHNVRRVRRELDFAVLWRWFDLQSAYPETYSDHRQIVRRIESVNDAPVPPDPEWERKAINRQPRALGQSVLRDLGTLIEAGDRVRPLPAAFDGIDAGRIRQFVPQYPPFRAGRGLILDAEAGFGYAVPVHRPDLPFNFGFYQNDTRTHGARRGLEHDEITPGVYEVHRLGDVTISPQSQIWFSARSWATKLQLGNRLFEAGGENRWEAWVSLKFIGPTYGDVLKPDLLPLDERAAYQGIDPADLVLVDRVILVNRSADQFE